MTISEITENIKTVSSKGLDVLRLETDKLLELLSKDLAKITEESNRYKKIIEEDTVKWEAIKREIEILEVQKEIIQSKVDEANELIKKSKEESESLLELHKILDNRKKVLDAREEEMRQKERRLT